MRRLLPLLILAAAIAALVWGAIRFAAPPIEIGDGPLQSPSDDGETGFEDPGHQKSLEAGDDPIGGLVLSPEGRPVYEAQVELYSQEDESWLDAVGRKPLVTLRTDRKGRFHLAMAEPGSYVLLARAKGMGEGLAVIPDFNPGQVRRVMVRLPPLVSLGGRVEDRLGRAVVGAEVFVLPAKTVTGFLRQAPEFRGLRLPKPVKVLTNEEGRFFAEELPATTYDIEVQSPGLVTASVYTVTPPAPELQVRMCPGITVKGTITWAEGTAPESIKVWMEPDGQAGIVTIGKTAATLEIADLPPGDHVVHAWAPGFGAASGDVHLQADQQAQTVDLNLTPGTVVSGRVTELYSGKPIALARVTLSLIDLVNGKQRLVDRETFATGPDGVYRFAPPPGRWVVRAEADNHLPVEDRRHRRSGELVGEPFVISTGAVSIKRDLVLRGNFVIRGRVVHPDGSPARAVVRTCGASLPPGTTKPPDNFSLGEMSRTDRDGYFRIEGVSPNMVFRVSASWGPDNRDEVGEVQFAPGEWRTSARELTISAPIPSSPRAAPLPVDSDGPTLTIVSGRVVDERRTPLPLALVSIGGVLANTDGEGRFRAPGIPPGTRSVRVVAASYPHTTFEQIHLKGGGREEIGDLVLPDHGVRVMGAVHSVDHEPIPDVRVTVRFNLLKEEFSLLTDALGRYEIEGPAAFKESVAVDARSAGYSPKRAQEFVVDTRVIDLELSPLLTVTVRIDGDTNSTPALSLSLRTWTKSGETSRVVRTMVPTGADKTWVARGIPEGTYTITLRAAGYAPIDLGSHNLANPAGHDLGRHALRSGGTVTGIVVNQSKLPVSGARVLLRTGEETRTDAGGKFRFEHVAPGSQLVTAYGPPRRPRPFSGKAKTKVKEGRTANVTIRLR